MQLRLGSQMLDCTHRTHVMGILNVDTDSPVGASVVPVDQAARRADDLRRAGASIIDVGAPARRRSSARRRRIDH